uniref:B30.2/SPRY domain-containing protein n=1 Tax=Petromyzon marinus TaxID=7757 RepID=S4RV32_PETMA
CSPTLNPDSAHPDIIVSGDLKTATWTRDPQLYCDHPDRFDYWIQVMSRENFSSGCHCWVVNVAEVESHRVGVVYGSMQRRGRDNACLVGFNSLSWCIRKLNNNLAVWHDKQKTELDVNEHPCRVGVCLNYDAGILSFYNADNRMLLHTYYARFTEPLHVVLHMWNGSLTLEPADDKCCVILAM